ncbi:MAG: PIN domain-containing protein [Acidobacteria bacterium]|nr:PIN domain-containing protein [Acidobacteriota bacterium]
MPFLLDVNALISLVDPTHLNHQPMLAWFDSNAQNGWATTPITENGFVRVLSLPRYPGRRALPEVSTANLRALKASYAGCYQFWDGISITDDTLFHTERIAGPNQITDAYLIALAIHHGGRLLSFDRRLPWQAVRGATAESIFTP